MLKMKLQYFGHLMWRYIVQDRKYNQLLGASTGVPTHDKVMWESSGGQGEPELKGCPSGPA